MANAAIQIINPVAPMLPVAPLDYSRAYEDQYNNILRLYFNKLDAAFAGFFNVSGGRFVSLPCGSFFSNVVQNASANVATVITLNNSDANASVATAITGNTVFVTYPGVYNYQFSAQLINTDTKDWNVEFWIRVNNVDVYESATVITVPSKHGQGNGAAVAAWNFFPVVQTGNSTIDLVWLTPSTTVTLDSQVAQTSPYVRPSIPSVISTVAFVSRLPA